MSRKRHLVQLLAFLMGCGALAAAARADPHPLPPEQRQQIRQQMREHWQQMPPPRMHSGQEYRERWQSLPADERQRLREDLRGQQEAYGGRHHRGGRGE